MWIWTLIWTLDFFFLTFFILRNWKKATSYYIDIDMDMDMDMMNTDVDVKKHSPY